MTRPTQRKSASSTSRFEPTSGVCRRAQNHLGVLLGVPALRRRFGAGVLSLHFPFELHYSELHPASSHPMTDPLWGNGQIEILHDVCIRRSEKLEQIVKSPHALSRLHVCWRKAVENCGYCAKCVRTALALRILGAKADAIPESSALEILREQRIVDAGDLTFLRTICCLPKSLETMKLVVY